VGRAASDFRQGVEAAAKWLRGREDDRGTMRYIACNGLADQMLKAVGDDLEGTEARTVAQIVQYMRETAFGQKDRAAIDRIANDIEQFDWKRQ
jgi:hypothetical protein